MRLFHRREEPPADIVALLPDGERVVSWADVAGGGVVLASPTGLWWPDGDTPRLIGWQHVSKAVWRDRLMIVTEADVVDDLLLVDRDPISVELEVPRDLPPVVRKRVTLNIVHSEVFAVPGGSARFVARRIPGADGVHWWARLEDDAVDHPAVRAEIEARREQLATQRSVP